MPSRLTNLRLNEVTLCASPANKGARVVMFKSAVPGLPHPHLGSVRSRGGGGGLGGTRTRPARSNYRATPRKKSADDPGAHIDFLVEKFLAEEFDADLPEIVSKLYATGIEASAEDYAAALKCATEVRQYLKREFSDDKRKELASSGAALPDGSFPIENAGDLANAMRAIGRAKDAAKAKAHIKARAKALGLTGKLTDAFKSDALDALFAKIMGALGFGKDGDARDFDAVQDGHEAREYASGMLDEIDEAVQCLRVAIGEIMCDEGTADKAGAIQNSVAQFKDHIQTVVPEWMESEVGKAVAAMLEATTKTESASEGVAMKPELMKALGLEPGQTTIFEAIGKSTRSALGLAATSTDDDVLKAIEGRALADAISKMSAAHTAYMNHDKATMPKGGKAAFANMTAAERDAHMKSNPTSGADAETDADKMAKAIALHFASNLPEPIRKALAAGEAALIEVGKLRDQLETVNLGKRASELSFVGKLDEVSAVLGGVSKLDPALGGKVEALLVAANKRIATGELLAEKGSAFQLRGSATEALDKLAREHVNKVGKDARGRPMTIEKARVEMRRANPELAKQEEQERVDRISQNRAA